MCRGSVAANSQEDAVRGVNYEISSVHHHGENYRHGVLHRPGQGPVNDLIDPKTKAVACAACIQGEMAVTLQNIPEDLQKELGIGPTAEALFISGDDLPDGQDKVEFVGGKVKDLYDLADRGITLSLGEAVQAPCPPAPVLERQLEPA